MVIRFSHITVNPIVSNYDEKYVQDDDGEYDRFDVDDDENYDEYGEKKVKQWPTEAIPPPSPPAAPIILNTHSHDDDDHHHCYDDYDDDDDDEMAFMMMKMPVPSRCSHYMDCKRRNTSDGTV